MSIELLKSISTQKVHKTCYKQGLILHYLGTNHSPNRDIARPLAMIKRRKIMQNTFFQKWTVCSKGMYN